MSGGASTVAWNRRTALCIASILRFQLILEAPHAIAFAEYQLGRTPTRLLPGFSVSSLLTRVQTWVKFFIFATMQMACLEHERIFPMQMTSQILNIFLN